MTGHCQAYHYKIPEPGKVEGFLASIADEAATQGMPHAEWQALAEQLDSFGQRWLACFERFGHSTAGELSFRDLILDFEESIALQVRPWLRGGAAAQSLDQFWSPLQLEPLSPLMNSLDRKSLMDKRQKLPPKDQALTMLTFDRPLFIISMPRSGSTLLFEALTNFPEVWSVGVESHGIIEGIPALHPAAHGYASNRLTAADAKPDVATALHKRFVRLLLDRDSRAYAELPAEQRPSRVRFIEKTPKNALRIPFLRAVFPNALFLVLYRRPEETLASMLDGWRSMRFSTNYALPGWPHRAWKFLLVPGWETLAHRPLIDIVAHQWRMTHETLLADIRDLPPSTWLFVRYADLVNNPEGTLRQIAQFAGLAFDASVERNLAGGLSWSSMTFSAPNPDKWRKYAGEIEAVLPGLEAPTRQIEQFCAAGSSPINLESIKIRGR